MSALTTKSRSFCLSVAGTVSLLALVGCASDKPPTLGERVAAAGESHAQLANRLDAANARKNAAEDDVRAAKKAIKRAQKDLEKSNADLEDSKARVVEARRELAQAEAEARSLGFEPAPAPQN